MSGQVTFHRLLALSDAAEPRMRVDAALIDGQLTVWVSVQHDGDLWATGRLERRAELDWRLSRDSVVWHDGRGAPVQISTRRRQSAGIDQQLRRVGPIIAAHELTQAARMALTEAKFAARTSRGRSRSSIEARRNVTRAENRERRRSGLNDTDGDIVEGSIDLAARNPLGLAESELKKTSRGQMYELICAEFGPATAWAYRVERDSARRKAIRDETSEGE